MYLFARTSTAKPDRVLEALAFATEIGAKVTSITGIEVRTWSAVYGAPINTISWTTRVDSQAAMGEAGEKLLADPGYLDSVAQASELFDGAPEDMLADIVAMAGNGGHSGEIASIVSAQVAGGKIAESMAWGVDMLNHVAGITGRDGLFTRSMYGPWASVGWISLANTMDEVDAATAAMASDPEYLTKVDSGSDLFLPGSGHQVLSRRIG